VLLTDRVVLYKGRSIEAIGCLGTYRRAAHSTAQHSAGTKWNLKPVSQFSTKFIASTHFFKWNVQLGTYSTRDVFLEGIENNSLRLTLRMR
jgi:hypothetical protein